MGPALPAINLRRAAGATVPDGSPGRRGRGEVTATPVPGVGLALGLALGALALGLGLAVPVHAECILKPDVVAPEGSHWSLHTDPATNRRCWVVVDNANRAAPPAPAAAAPTSTLGTFLENLIPTTSPPPPAEPPAAEPAPARKPAPSRAAAAAPALKPAHPDMTPEQREALFSAFMRWHDSQHADSQHPDDQHPDDPGKDQR